MALSASVFRRGGPKKELFAEAGATDGAAGGQEIQDDDRLQLNEELQQLLELLEAPKVGRDLSAAIWRPAMGAAELVLSRRSTGQPMGFVKDRKHYLHIEEAAFLVDRADLLLFVEKTSEDDEEGGGAAGKHQLLSMQEVFELMEMCGVCMERYVVYAYLSRSGYLVTRYPSVWVLDHDQHPRDVWGHGAWAHCCRMAPTSAATLAAADGERGLEPAAATTSTTTLAGAVASTAALLRGLHQAAVPQGPFEMEEEGEGGGDGVAQGLEGLTAGRVGAARCVAHKEAVLTEVQAQGKRARGGVREARGDEADCAPEGVQQAQVKKARVETIAGGQQQQGQGQEQQHGGGVSDGVSVGGCGDQAGTAATLHPPTSSLRPPSCRPPVRLEHGCRLWWEPACGAGDGPGVTLQQQQQQQVPPSVSGQGELMELDQQQALVGGGADGFQAQGAGGMASQGQLAQGCGTCVDLGPGADVRARFPRLRVLPAIRTSRAQAAAGAAAAAAGAGVGGAQGAGNASGGSSVDQGGAKAGPPSAGHLVFDVYRPGAKVARNKRAFPTPMCHVALSCLRPPSLPEMWMADDHAISSLVPVKWANVVDGIASMYEIGAADILKLM